MTAMTCKLSGLFSIGEDFDDEDLLGTDWDVRGPSGPGDEAAAAVSSSALRASSVGVRDRERRCPQRPEEKLTTPSDGAASGGSRDFTTAAAGGLRQLSTSTASSAPLINTPPVQTPADAASTSCVAQDDFDDWDVDLADLDECATQTVQTPLPPPPPPASSAKMLRPSSCGATQSLPGRTSTQQQCGSTNQNIPARVSSPGFPSAPSHRPGVFPGVAASSPAPSPISRTPIRPQQPQRRWSTPGSSPQTRNLFETVSPAPSPSSISPHPLHTPVLTNRLVQLVSASNKLPKKRQSSEPHRPRTRRFPGPAGLLPQQPQGQSLDDIVVSVPHIPAHGVAVRPPSQGSSSQPEEDEFGGGGAWAAMKAEMGLDERNPSCFLHSYSVVMVLRKAALKQLSKNKVPNMAVVLKSIIHTHADAKAVFKDPTGEIQGTVHRRLLEDRAEELKVGAVLLLKQVGVFSPSHRNHYLNVTPNNLLRIYSPDGVALSSAHLPPLAPEPSSSPSPSVLRGPVSQMHLVFDDEDDEGQEGERFTERSRDPPAPTGVRESLRGSGENPAPQDSGWEADDDLDELLGELPEDTYSL